MELHWLSFLVITILVSISAQDVYDPSNDIYSHKRGYPNVMPYEPNNQYNQKSNVEENYKPYWPVQYVEKNPEDHLALRGRGGRIWGLKLQKQETRKLKKLLAKVEKAVPPLMKLLKYSADDNDGFN